MKINKVNQLLYCSFLLTSIFVYSMDPYSDRVVETYQPDGLSKLIVSNQMGDIDVVSWEKKLIQIEICKRFRQEKYRSHLYSTTRKFGDRLSIEGTIEPYTEVIAQSSTGLQQGLGSFHEDEFGNVQIVGIGGPGKLVFKGGGKCTITSALHHTETSDGETKTYGPGTTIRYSGGKTTRHSLSTGSIERIITDFGLIWYKVSIPYLAALKIMLKTRSGNITTQNIAGFQELNANGINGKILVVNAHQAIKAKGKDLNIHQADDAKGDIRATDEGDSIIGNFAEKLKVETKGSVMFYRNPRNKTGLAQIFTGNNIIKEGPF